MDAFLPDCKISKDHGRAKRYRGQVYFPVYHPAAALYTGSLKQTLADDFAKLPQLLERLGGLDKPETLEIEPALAAVRTAQQTTDSKPTNESKERKEQPQLFS